MKNKKIVIIFLTIILIGIGIFSYLYLTKDSKTTTKTNTDTSINTDDGDEDIDWSKYKTYNLKLDSSTEITKEGIYNISGNIKEGMLSINTNGNVKLVLNGITITSKDSPCIYVENAKNVVIDIEKNSTLTDSSTRGTEELDGVIYSTSDLIIEGTATLEIHAKYKDGIVSKDDLKIKNGKFIIESNDDAIRGKDSVYIIDGEFMINSLGDGIKSTNTKDSDKGFIYIKNGKFDITSTLDGISAEDKLVIDGGEFKITTGGGSSNSSKSENWGRWGNSSSSESKSAKGIKAGSNILINDGEFTISSSDDSIHSNNYINIKSGKFNISSGDDGIHADTKLVIDNGEININKSYEGIESANITINNGKIKVYATDDGINIGGGNDSSGMNRPGENNYTETSNNILTINDGDIYVSSVGDGIDVNGSAYINGGKIVVEGSENNGNGGLDYDGEFKVTNAEIVVISSSGMYQGVSSDDEYNLQVIFTNTYQSGTIVSIVDSDNNEISSIKSTKSFSSLTLASPKLEKKKTYTIKVNNQEYQTFTIDNLTTTIGTIRNNMGRR